MELKDRIAEIMSAKRWQIADVVSVAHVTSSAVSQWLGRGSKPIHSIGNIEAAERLEAATGFCSLWIARGIGPKFVSDRDDQSEKYVAREPLATYRSSPSTIEHLQPKEDPRRTELLLLFGQLDEESQKEWLAELRGFVKGRRPHDLGRAPKVAG